MLFGYRLILFKTNEITACLFQEIYFRFIRFIGRFTAQTGPSRLLL